MTNEYLPIIAKIESFKEEAENIRTFVFSLPIKNCFDFKPGQFIMLSVFGYGEAAFAPSSFPVKDGRIKITVAKVGKLTTQLFSMKTGDKLGIRGPFGNCFDINAVKKRNIIAIAGGMGMGALKPLIEALILKRKSFGKIDIFFGARTRQDMPFKDDVNLWSERKNVRVETTVDFPDANWKGKKGVVGLLLDDLKIDSLNTSAFVCGPDAMLDSIFSCLIRKGMRKKDIITSLERQMKCGIGFCGHCRIDDKYVCTDGPVFRYDEIESF
ncbi:MAG: hypothetical protein A2W05_07380 [Candidatus Schekmanbacteria bacterium RBG_16_38_10]|uniref:FAD-binding FR-type domain-containing protein n=1 Tax=Candidatus Schekmanbacteria bacterium RBG_16_38_10 TaxID=1817879 RepID=A0A1F7RR53_9BACT|nr:MAG: hypothetical protein A2W05_07380 [Candidatus Schekmanbacteria bacterium RBG_16_38_10]